ncbi:MAG TPA: hypothetical protein VK498_13600 [Ferruginibacter sp.]|nr:hypothetical protein [Ferruginibacter sp.]
MKFGLTLFFLAFLISANAQVGRKEQPIQIVERISLDYTGDVESTDSEKDKNEIKTALLKLQKKSKINDLPVLIDAWMYYDPTDFPTRELIEPIFNKDKPAALNAINKRFRNKKKWENKKTAPYTDLIELRKQIMK